MGRVARSVWRAADASPGFIPKFLIKRENALLSREELIVVDDMHQRKQMMFDRSDALLSRCPAESGRSRNSLNN